MEQLVNGKFEYIVPELRISESNVAETVAEGEDYQSDFFFGTEDSSIVKGMLFSDNRRIILSKDSFSGNAISVFYRVDTSGLEVGECCRGTITICSSLGEYHVAIEITIGEREVKTSQGRVHDLREFTNLAKDNYKEAFRIYSKDTFRQLLKGEETSYKELYRGLSKNPVTYQHMEEFLIATGQKDAVDITIDKAEKEFLNIESSTKDTLFINKNTWGHLRLEIEVKGNFLATEKKVVTAEDFIGSVYSLEYVILRERLKAGRHHGEIRIKSAYKTLVYEITASSTREYVVSNSRFEKRVTWDLAHDYLMLSVKHIEYRTWKDQTLANLEKLKEAGALTLMHRLYEAYLYYAEDNAPKTLDAMSLLKGQLFTKDEYEEEGLYLYLGKQTGLIGKEDIDVSQRIETLYRKNQNSFLLLWLLLHVNEEFTNNKTKQLYMLERQFEMGCNSPFLYLEATKIIITDESLLKKLSPFMILTISFAQREDMLTEEMAHKFAYLSSHEKKYSANLYRILEGCYEQYPDKEVLEAICKLVMLGNPRKSEYFKWYKRAIEQNVRITRLYEYYVETFDRKEQIPLPREVKLYFAYNNTLGDNKKAFVYANIIRNKESDKEVYAKYVDIIKSFAEKSLREHKMNEDYAIIYQEHLTNIEDKETAKLAAQTIFAHRLYCGDDNIRNVIVCHGPLKEEQRYPCINNVAYIDIYTDDAQIIFEDAHRQRFAATVDYNLQKLFDNQKIIEQCIWQDVKDDGLLLNICGSNLKFADVNIRNLGGFQHIVESPGFTEDYRQNARQKLLYYYDKHAGERTVNEYLSKIDYRGFYKVNPTLLIDILIRRGFNHEAFELVCDRGYEKVEAMTMFKLCRAMILDTEFIENEELIDLAYYVLINDKYDSVILSYLQDNYIGSAEAMLKLYERLKGFDLDTYAIEEEILLLAMYSRVYHAGLSSVLESYMEHRGKESVIKAFLAFLSYGYFIGDIRIDRFVFRCLEEQFEAKEQDDIITSLALLKRYRYCHKLTEEQQANAVAILELCQEHNLRFALFADLPKAVTKAFQIEDKVFVEEIISPTAEVVLYYCLGRDKEQLEYTREPLNTNYHGIFTREFLLFYGEQLRWYMTIQDGDMEIETPPQTITMNRSTQDVGSKYQMLNQMLADRRLDRDEILEKTMDQYLRREQLIEDTFTLVE